MLSKYNQWPSTPCCNAPKDRVQYNQFTGHLQCLSCNHVYTLANPSKILHTVEALRELVWGYDIPSPTTPEYREHHDSIQSILKFIDEKLLKELSDDK